MSRISPVIVKLLDDLADDRIIPAQLSAVVEELAEQLVDLQDRMALMVQNANTTEPAPKVGKE